ncbi:MAG TPA: LysM peptidoglycan-binding domain-containing protein [Bacillota bacterium]|nr:LysM peptidoglycan-binding domain-containing protein [Bacillota bacterium]
MGIQLEHRRLSFSRVSGQGMAEVHTQRSCALPADCPDMSDAQAEAVLWAQGIPIVKSVEPGEGQVKVSGYVRSQVLYVARGEPDSAERVSIDDPRFEVVIAAPGVSPDDAATAEVTIAHFEAESTGARTLQLTAALAVSAQAFREVAVDVAVAAQATGGSRITVHTESVTLSRPVASPSERVQVGETLGIPEGNPPCILDARSCGVAGWARVAGVQTSDGKVSVEGELVLEIAYAPARAAVAVNIVRFERVPFHKSFDIPDARKSMGAKARVELAEVVAIPVSDGAFRVEAAVDVSIELAARERVPAVVEITSETQEIVDTETKSIIVEEMVGEGAVDIDVEDTVPISALAQRRSLTGMEEIKGSLRQVGLSEAEASDGEATVRGLLRSRVFLSDVEEDDAGTFPVAFALEMPVEFSDSVEIPDVIEGDRIEITSVSESVFVERAGPAKLDVQGSIRIGVAAYRQTRVSVVTAAETMTPVSLDPFAMTFYVVGAGDTLPRIARRYGVPPDKIALANGMAQTDVPEPGQKLYIPARR